MQTVVSVQNPLHMTQWFTRKIIRTWLGNRFPQQRKTKQELHMFSTWIELLTVSNVKGSQGKGDLHIV